MSASNRATRARSLALEITLAEGALAARLAEARSLLDADADAEAAGGRAVFRDGDVDVLAAAESRAEVAGRAARRLAERLRLRTDERRAS